ncbi:hypothetical protein [uncultured Winogradskyella sp.]|uniref:hypothetical protein n=1 Tax=uncultured Winogradskyella sp. TaxID=395353 RepID=UPI0026130E19|nr:hypothetical protein [uncultured Winogradskyella sp.]
MNNIRLISTSAVFWGSLLCFVVSVILNAFNSKQAPIEIVILSGLLVVSYYCNILFFSSQEEDRFNGKNEDDTLRKYVFFSHALFVVLAGLAVAVLSLNSSLTLMFLLVLSFLGLLSWLINATYLKWDNSNWQKNLIGIVFDLSSFSFVIYLTLYPAIKDVEAGIVGFIFIFILHVSINIFEPLKKAIAGTWHLFAAKSKD